MGGVCSRKYFWTAGINRDAVQGLADNTLVSSKDRWDVVANCQCLDGSLDERQGILHGVDKDTVYISTKGAIVNVSG